MSRQALYRKYRSKTLDEVIGQEHVTEVLEAAIKSKVFSHAYLFTGPRGIGKTSVARIVAHMVNDLPYGETSFDIIEIDAASHGLKEDIKDLIEKARIAPTREKYKVYIIDEIHSMKHDAFNTFLKLLEEPPEHVIFILATTDPQKLPPTILSRAQRFHFRPVEAGEVIKHLKTLAKKEKIDIDDDALKMIAERGEGSMRDSISLLDQLGGLGKKITTEVLEELLGLAPGAQIDELIKALDSKDMPKISQILHKLRGEGLSPGTIVGQLNSKLITSGHYELVEKLLDVPKATDPWLKFLAVLGSYIGKQVAPKVEGVKEKYVKLEAKNPKLEVVAEKSKLKAETKKPEVVAKPQEENPKTKPEPSVAAEDSGAVAKKSAPIEIDWQKIVEESKKLNGPCGAWIGQGSHEYDGETLTLYFRTKLLRNKMKEQKCWQTLKNALISLYETPPEIVVSDGPKPKSAEASKVADIMGGGELL